METVESLAASHACPRMQSGTGVGQLRCFAIAVDHSLLYVDTVRF